MRLLLFALLASCNLPAQVVESQNVNNVGHKAGAASTAAWTSATGADTAVTIAVGNYSAVSASFRVSGGSITAGTINFEVSDDGTNWFAAAAVRSDSLSSESTYVLTGSNRLWSTSVAGFTNFRIRLNPAITGAGTANIRAQAVAAAIAPQAVVGSAQLPPALVSSRLDVNVGNTATVTANAGTGTLATDPTDDATRVLGRVRLRNPGDTVDIGDGTNPVRTDPTGTTTQPISGTVTANAGTGNFTSVGTKSSNGGAPGSSNIGTLPAIANAAAPTHTEGNQVGTSVDLSGNQRVILAAGTNNIGDVDVLTFPDNEPFNVAQIAGNTTLTGNGTTGTGSQRVTVASDSSARAVGGEGATGSAVPSGAVYIGGIAGGNLTGILSCRDHAFLNMTTATTTQIVAASGSTVVFICSLSLQSNGTSAVKLVYGTGTNCGTGTNDLSPNWDFTAQTGIAEGNGLGMLYKTPASQAVCVTSSAAVNVHARVTYTQF